MSEPFSRTVRADSIPRDGQTITIEASPAEREALATLFKLPSIESLTADFTLTRAPRGEVEPDPIVDGKIDLGALAAEFFALGLDPYPRKPGVEFEPPVEEEEDKESPFSALRRASTKIPD
jgi:hypothetical protein